MKYATDNRVVNWLYDLTTGPRRHFFYLIVALLVGVGVYMPVRDFYIAHRTEAILQEQKAIREKYNDSLGKEVESLLSQEGIEDAARRDYGMVMPGEQTITVEGLDEDGNPVVVDVNDQDGEDAAADGDGGDAQDPSTANGAASKDNAGTLKGEDAADKSKTGSDVTDVSSGDTPVTSAEVEAAERAVLENSAWYWKVLDTSFSLTVSTAWRLFRRGERTWRKRALRGLTGYGVVALVVRDGSRRCCGELDQAHGDHRSGRGRGRVWRVCPGRD